jgi:hypothetical protein
MARSSGKRGPFVKPTISPQVFAVVLLVGMVLLLSWPFSRCRPNESEGERGSLGTIEGAVFALFGLLMAFPFSGAALFNEKRSLVTEEANTIETAYHASALTPAGSSAQDSGIVSPLCGLTSGDLSATA